MNKLQNKVLGSKKTLAAKAAMQAKDANIDSDIMLDEYGEPVIFGDIDSELN